MTTVTHPAKPSRWTPSAPERRTRALRAFRAHLRNETRLLLREPATLIFGAALPLAAIIVMAAIPGAREPLADFGGLSVVRTYLPVLVLFATSVLGLTVAPAILGGYRKDGVLRRLRTTPAPPSALLAALFVALAAVGLIVTTLLVGIPAVAGAGTPAHPGWFGLAAMLGLLAFLALGTLLASLVRSPQGAAGIGNVIAAVMWFSAGLWLPRVFFPGWLVTLTDLTPGGAATQAMLDATVGVPPSWQPYAVLVAWTVAVAWLATRTFRWE